MSKISSNKISQSFIFQNSGLQFEQHREHGIAPHVSFITISNYWLSFSLEQSTCMFTKRYFSSHTFYFTPEWYSGFCRVNAELRVGPQRQRDVAHFPFRLWLQLPPHTAHKLGGHHRHQQYHCYDFSYLLTQLTSLASVTIIINNISLPLSLPLPLSLTSLSLWSRTITITITLAYTARQ